MNWKVIKRPWCWIVNHNWWEKPKGFPYLSTHREWDTLVLNLFTPVSICLRCLLKVPNRDKGEENGEIKNTC